MADPIDRMSTRTSLEDLFAAQPEWSNLPVQIQEHTLLLFEPSSISDDLTWYQLCNSLNGSVSRYIKAGQQPDWPTLIAATYVFRLECGTRGGLFPETKADAIAAGLIDLIKPDAWPTRATWDGRLAQPPCGTKQHSGHPSNEIIRENRTSERIVAGSVVQSSSTETGAQSSGPSNRQPRPSDSQPQPPPNQLPQTVPQDPSFPPPAKRAKLHNSGRRNDRPSTQDLFNFSLMVGREDTPQPTSRSSRPYLSFERPNHPHPSFAPIPTIVAPPADPTLAASETIPSLSDDADRAETQTDPPATLPRRKIVLKDRTKVPVVNQDKAQTARLVEDVERLNKTVEGLNTTVDGLKATVEKLERIDKRQQLSIFTLRTKLLAALRAIHSNRIAEWQLASELGIDFQRWFELVVESDRKTDEYWRAKEGRDDDQNREDADG